MFLKSFDFFTGSRFFPKTYNFSKSRDRTHARTQKERVPEEAESRVFPWSSDFFTRPQGARTPDPLFLAALMRSVSSFSLVGIPNDDAAPPLPTSFRPAAGEALGRRTGGALLASRWPASKRVTYMCISSARPRVRPRDHAPPSPSPPRNPPHPPLRPAS